MSGNERELRQYFRGDTESVPDTGDESTVSQDTSGSLSEEEAIEREASRRRQSDEGDPDEVEPVADPDSGDDTTRQLKSDADSDPLREVTEEDGSGLSEEERLEREASEARQRQREQETTTRRQEFGGVGSVTGPEDTTPTDSTTAPEPSDVQSAPTGGEDSTRGGFDGDGSLDGSGGGGGGGTSAPSPSDVQDGPSGGGRDTTEFDELTPEQQRRVTQSIGGVSEVERGILEPEDFAVQTREGDSGEEMRTIVLGESGRRALAARAVRQNQDVDRFDPDSDLRRVGPGAYEATVGVDGEESIAPIAFSEEGSEALQDRQRRRIREDAAEQFSEQTGTDIEPTDIALTTEDGRVSAGLTAEATGELTGGETTPREEFGDVGGAPETTTPREEFGDVQSIEDANDTVQRLERGVQEQIGQARARSLGISPSLLSEENLRTLGGEVERGEDFTVSGDVESGVSARLTPGASDELTREFAERAIEGQTGADLGEGDIELTESTTRFEELGSIGSITTGDTRDTGGGVRLTEQGQRRIRTDPQERFGTGGLIPERYEPVLRSAAADIDETFTDLTQPIDEAEEGDVVLDTAIDDALMAAGVDKQTASRVERAERAGVRGTLQLLNAPAVAIGVEEGIEFGQYQAEQIIEGEGADRVEPRGRVNQLSINVLDEDPETIDVEAGLFEGGSLGRAEVAAGEAASAAGQYAYRQPIEAGGMLVGSLIGSAAIMGGAARLSSRAGTASRFAIQPGEEIAGYSGNFLTRAVASERTAERLFPNNEPIFMSEEFALRTARRAVGGARRLTPNVEVNVGSSVRSGTRAARSRVPDVELAIDPDRPTLELSEGVRRSLSGAGFRERRATRELGLSPRPFSTEGGGLGELGGRVRTGAAERLDSFRQRRAARETEIGSGGEADPINLDIRRRASDALYNYRTRRARSELDLSPTPGRGESLGDALYELDIRRRGSDLLYNYRLGRARSEVDLGPSRFDSGRPEVGANLGERLDDALYNLDIRRRGSDLLYNYRMRRARSEVDLGPTRFDSEPPDLDIFGRLSGRLSDYRTRRARSELSMGPTPIEPAPPDITGAISSRLETYRENRARSELALGPSPIGRAPDLVGGITSRLGRLPELRDLTIRIGYSEVDTDALGGRAILSSARAEADVETVEGIEEGASGAGVGMSGRTFEVEQETDSGVLIERVYTSPETEAVVETETRRSVESRPTRRVETTLPNLVGDGLFGGEVVGGVAAGSTRSDLFETGDLRSEMAPDTELLSETQASQDVERVGIEAFDLRTELAAGQELELEVPTEFGLELELELEVPTEIETEIEADREDRRGPDDEFNPLGVGTPFAQRLERDLINPFTGE